MKPDARGRYPTQPDAQTADVLGGMSRLTQRNYGVQDGTGYSYSTVQRGQWVRGVLPGFQYTPAYNPPDYPTMYDPTDPRTWR